METTGTGSKLFQSPLDVWSLEGHLTYVSFSPLAYTQELMIIPGLVRTSQNGA